MFSAVNAAFCQPVPGDVNGAGDIRSGHSRKSAPDAARRAMSTGKQSRFRAAAGAVVL